MSPRSGVGARTRSRRRPVHLGCSGWNYRDWRGAFYPAGCASREWLSYYASHFGTVEVNTTFYRLLARQTAARWVTQTPPGFVFAVKASRYLTHVKRLEGIGEGVARFYERIEPLRDAGRLGPVLWQLPESFHRDERRLRGALELLPKGLHAFEFRHESWFVESVYELLRARGAALVIGDHPSRPFQPGLATAGWRYVRFHHGSHGRRGNYSRAELQRWARRMRSWLAAGEETYAYFNNDWEAFAPRNAALLEDLLQKSSGR